MPCKLLSNLQLTPNRHSLLPSTADGHLEIDVRVDGEVENFRRKTQSLPVTINAFNVVAGTAKVTSRATSDNSQCH